MVSVDTNVLVRLFVDDPTAAEQVRKVRERLTREELSDDMTVDTLRERVTCKACQTAGCGC